jgi:type I restriction-modification system DNA methylase subunit
LRKEEEKIKSLGQVFTPSEIAEFIVNWCVRNSSDKVLDPCAGDGIFTQAVIRRFLELNNYETKENIYSIEKDWQLFLKLKQTF